MTDLDDFIAHDIEGYLFHDIRAMQSSAERPGEVGGGLSYPLLMTTLAGIELFGALLSPNQFNTFSGDSYFKRYWKDFLYPASIPKAAAADAVYKLARHGIAHAFLLKGPLLIIKGHPGHHLAFSSFGELYIDATQLSNDLIESYEQRIKPFLACANGAVDPVSMGQRLQEIAADYRTQSARPLGAYQSAGAPMAPTGAAPDGSGSGPGYTMPSSAISQSFGSGQSGPTTP